MSRKYNVSEYLYDIAETLRFKTQTTDKIKPVDFPYIVDEIFSKHINCVGFYDYNGELIHKITSVDFLNLASMPTLPEHDGLICQGWNWNLEDAKNYVRKYGFLNIGATYITDDGSTRFYIKLETNNINIPLVIRGEQEDNSLLINWGDGTEEVVNNIDGGLSHKYRYKGDYIISLKVNSGLYLLGSGSEDKGVLGIEHKLPANSLYKVELGNGVLIGDYAFKGHNIETVTISDKITEIGCGAFNDCLGLTGINLPKTVINIKEESFKYCSNLYVACLPNTVSNIGYEAFSSCDSLQSFNIPESITHINDFIQHSNIQSITIPDSVTSIGDRAFYGCEELKNITIPDSVTSIGNYVFCSCEELKNITIPDSVTSIGDQAFDGCFGLESVYIPDTTQIIGEGLTSNTGENYFANNVNLQSVHIPSTVTNISGYFSGCKSLRTLFIPNSVVDIGWWTFSDCISMQRIDFTSHIKVPKLSLADTFDDIPKDCKIIVPVALYNDWVNATNWSSYADYIVMDTDITEYTSLTIAADDVSGRKTNTTIYWEVVANGVNKYTGEIVTGIRLNGTDVSDEFDQNTSTTDTVTRTITYTKYGLTAATTITQGVWINAGYEIDLNSNWQLSSTIANPDSSLYDGVYESFSNKGVNSTTAIMYIDIVGYADFSLYIRSYAESNYDYVMVSQLDQTINNSTSYSDTTLVKAHTRGSQISGTAISNYKLVEFTGIDEGEHRITIVYRKDSGGHYNDDRGYLIIQKK